MLNNGQKNELTNILKNLVEIPSINPPGKEIGVTKYLCELFDTEGIKNRVIRVSEDRYVVVAKISGHSHDNALIFTGHQDVVPVSEDEIDRWNTDPFSAIVKEGKIYGRGSSDMKGGVSAAVYAALMLKRNNIVPNNDILLVLTCDEEHYMYGSREAIKDAEIKSAKYCIVCEPTEMKICYASKGRTWAEIVVHGKTAHGSQRGLGINAIEKCSDLIQKIMKHDFSSKEHELTGTTFWQPYAVSAGVEPAIVPDRCSMFVDARLTLEHYPNEIWEDMRDIIKSIRENDKNFSADINIIESREPWITPKEEYIVRLAKEMLVKNEISVEYDIFMGTTDGTKFNSIGITPIIFGPGDLSCVHKENEFIELEQLYRATEVYFDIMTNYKG